MIEIRKTEVYAKWIDGLRDVHARARILARVERLAMGNPGDVKPVGEGVSELRINYGPGYRVYYTQRGWELVILLAGGDKSTQARDIKSALRLARNLYENIMTKTITTRYDVAEHLRTPEDMAAYLEACLEEANGDAAFIAKALGDIARAKGMSQVARDAGLSRESLYKALSGERTPGFDTILKVIGALGLKLHAEAIPSPGSKAQQDTPADSRNSRG
jgi:putative addiction module killer protein/probable addiction module antidote protein